MKMEHNVYTDSLYCHCCSYNPLAFLFVTPCGVFLLALQSISQKKNQNMNVQRTGKRYIGGTHIYGNTMKSGAHLVIVDTTMMMLMMQSILIQRWKRSRLIWFGDAMSRDFVCIHRSECVGLAAFVNWMLLFVRLGEWHHGECGICGKRMDREENDYISR